ncbi:hypothetical protein AN958_04302 [Leucoagaricus sp. SymC.cos]|nr:hypothetical protein AN958_04302 [Leucoagaricus sp. SymC.cos]
MSRRSYDSYAHGKRLSKHRVTDEELFDYVLRVADMFDSIRDGSKSVKFPEKLLKVLEQKLQAIAMGKDPGYSDQLVRRTMAKFYGQLMVDSFKRQMKDSRKIEDLILMFATHTTSVLKKEPTLAAGDGWKLELNNQIAIFVKMLRECLRNVNHVSPELLARLDTYTAKLAPATGGTTDSGYDSTSTSRDRDSVHSTRGAASISSNVSDMPMVKTVAKLLKMADHDIQVEVDKLRNGTVTDKAAITDLKTCLKNINAGESFPGRREDFESDNAWQHWKTLETTHLQQLMVAMVQVNPELAKSTSPDGYTNDSSDRPTSYYEKASRHGSISSRRSLYDPNESFEPDDDLPVGHHFTYIPPNPKRYYKRLVEHCLLADLEIMLSPEVDDNDEVSLGILSHPHLELINECALRWRIGHPYRAVCFLDLVRQFYERNEVPMECIPEALQGVFKALSDTSLEYWTIPDIDYLVNIYGSLFNVFLSSLYHSMEALPNLKPADVSPYVAVLEKIRDSGLLERTDIDIPARMGDIQERTRQVTAQWYEAKMGELQAAPGVNRALPLLYMTDELEKAAKLLDKRFPESLFGYLDIVSLYVEISVPYLVTEIQNSQKRLFESSMNGPTPDVPIQDIFALYRRTNIMLDMYGAFCPQGDLTFNLSEYFEPYVRQWLLNTENKTGQWVEAAIAADKFEAEGTEGHSSSIVDLFDSLRSPINFLQDLQWADEYQEARFFTHLSKSISSAVEQYRRSVESLFLTEMYPRPTEYLQPQKSSAWLEKARQLALTGEKKVEPFNFLPQSCVKLNNIEAARRLLDNMYEQMEADKISEVLKKAPPVPEKVEKNTFLFSVKIVIAENLVSLDGSPSTKLDTFVTLSDETGKRMAKTRTIYESLNPRWYFEPYVRQWLLNTENKTGQWVEAAIAADKFEAEGTEGHSSSIVDLFDSLRSPINFLQDLQWADEYQEARFFTHLSKSISSAVEQYRRSVESLFLTEMYPRPTEYLQPQKSSAWLEKARQLALTGEKKVEPFNFLPQSCVKLNNIEAARRLLDNMYEQMQADKISEVLKKAPPVPEKVEKNTFLFSVKIVIAENLVSLDGSLSTKLDTFVTLSDETGKRMAKTRTIYESLNPRWDETFDISVEKPLWLMVSVRDRALVGKHDIVGRAYLCLDPRRFGDLLAHELWMDLDTQGRILVRVSMEGEKDDIQFYFGRAFRSLKRAEADMLRIFIDKMSPFIQQCLERSVIKTLLKSREQGLDYNKAIGNVTALYHVEVEQAILPLFDYFDANLQTLNTYLSDTAKEMVMTRVWKEILTVIEGLLIPPLSDASSDMKPLSDKEVDIVFKWLKFLRDYFYAGGEGPVPLESLQNQKYRDVLSIRLYYDWHTDALMEECVRMMQQSLRQAPTMKKRAKSVYQQRNLGTIKERKKEKKQEPEPTSEQTIMRILRMRPRTQEFIAQQMQISAAMQAEQEQRAREAEERKAKRAASAANRTSHVPPVPPLPPQKS